MAAYWPKKELESYKLCAKESDWNLAGCTDLGATRSRTRSGGGGKPKSDHRRQQFLEPVSDADADDEAEEEEEVEAVEEGVQPVAEEEEVDEVLELDDESEEVVTKRKAKPAATRVIVEVAALMETLQKNCRCMDCGGELEPMLKTTCIATSIKLTCKDTTCGYIFYSDPPASADLDPTLDKRERTTDYAINILFVVGLLSCGDGCSEAAKLLGLLGLPNDTTMEGRSFGTIEDRISKKIHQVTDQILLENLVEEVRLSVQDINSFNLWNSALTSEAIVLPTALYPRIQVSYDMAWQQRNSGNRYASPSGHAVLVGKHCRKPLALVIKSKLCNYCSTYKKKHPTMTDDDIPPHVCTKNHVGSSASMEPVACLEMVQSAFDQWNCIVESICCDDDASTRSLLRWSNEDHMANNKTTTIPQVPITKGKNIGNLQDRPDKGQLPGHIPEPMFVADPNHRRKVLTGELYALATAKVAEKKTMTRMDSSRLGKNFGYFIRSLPNIPECDYVDRAKAVLEHHFGNHTHCGAWCRRKSMTPQQLLESKSYYRDKKKDAVLYDELSKKVARFITLDRLKEVAHGMDSQVNESLNNTVSWFAPKNKVYCGTQSLGNRIGLALGINALGHRVYFGRLFKALGISMTNNVAHFLEIKDKARSSRLYKLKTREKKKDRNKRHHAKLAEDTATAQKERDKRDGTYRRGMNMDPGGVDGYTQEDFDQPSKKKPRTVATCKHCGRKGHSTTRSKACLHHKQPAQQQQAAPVPRPVEDDASDVSDWDAMPLQDEVSDADLFEDAGTWSEDDDQSVGIMRATI
jgi:hypothetical protein